MQESCQSANDGRYTSNRGGAGFYRRPGDCAASSFGQACVGQPSQCVTEIPRDTSRSILGELSASLLTVGADQVANKFLTCKHWLLYSSSLWDVMAAPAS